MSSQAVSRWNCVGRLHRGRTIVISVSAWRIPSGFLAVVSAGSVISHELLRRVDRSAASEVKVVDCWSREEVDALLRAARDHESRFHPALATLFYTGMRRGELLGLKWADIDFDRQQIHVRRAYGA